MHEREARPPAVAATHLLVVPLPVAPQHLCLHVWRAAWQKLVALAPHLVWELGSSSYARSVHGMHRLWQGHACPALHCSCGNQQDEAHSGTPGCHCCCPQA